MCVCWGGGPSFGPFPTQVDFERAIIAEYPSRESYLQMGSDPEYIAHAAHRHAGVEHTYIVSVVPELVVN